MALQGLPVTGELAASGGVPGCRPRDLPPDRGGTIPRRAPRPICAACPVREACLEHALAVREKHGVWGGLTERERRRVICASVAAPPSRIRPCFDRPTPSSFLTSAPVTRRRAAASARRSRSASRRRCCRRRRALAASTRSGRRPGARAPGSSVATPGSPGSAPGRPVGYAIAPGPARVRVGRAPRGARPRARDPVGRAGRARSSGT